MAELINVKCPSCGENLAAPDESGLVNVLQEHLYEEHALDMTRERVHENVVAQLQERFRRLQRSTYQWGLMDGSAVRGGYQRVRAP